MDKKISYIKERVLQIAQNKGVSYDKFCKDIGMTYGSFKGSQKKTTINSDALDKILSINNEVSPDWLLTGKGSMYRNSLDILNENTATYKLRTDKNLENQSVPYYNLQATASLVGLFQNQSDETPIDYISIPNLPKCDGALPITGDSMYPLLKSGDIVMFKKMENNMDDILFGEMYLISFNLSGDEFVTVKWIQKSNSSENYIKLVSENKHHQPKEIHIKKIRALALIKASIRINAMG